MEIWNAILEDIAPDRIILHLVTLGIAYLLALPIGWNREVEERSAGLRTFPLVAVAACGFLQATESLMDGSPEATARIIEGVITGIGFIGGGAILQMKDRVQGTATAASLWATGAMGVAVGVGSYDVAVIIMIITFVTLGMLNRLKKEAHIDQPLANGAPPPRDDAMT
jgi:putative Mg2+ transporter-C (MgtC) family protein